MHLVAMIISLPRTLLQPFTLLCCTKKEIMWRCNLWCGEWFPLGILDLMQSPMVFPPITADLNQSYRANFTVHVWIAEGVSSFARGSMNGWGRDQKSNHFWSHDRQRMTVKMGNNFYIWLVFTQFGRRKFTATPSWPEKVTRLFPGFITVCLVSFTQVLRCIWVFKFTMLNF